MIWTLEDILGDENDPEFSNPTHPNFQLANYLRQTEANTPMAPTTTSQDLPVATEVAELEASTPNPAGVSAEVPDMDITVEEFDKLLSDAIDNAHLEDYAKAADEAEKEGRAFSAIPLEQAREEIENAREEVRSSRRREPMEDDSEEEQDRRRKIPTSASGPEPYDYSKAKISAITDDMPPKDADLQNKINLRITETKMDEQHKKNKAEAERGQLFAKATARREHILGLKTDGQVDGEVEAARARARSSRRHEFIAMEEKELAEGARRHQIAENTTKEGDGSGKFDDLENDDQVCGNGDAAQEEESEEEEENKKSVHEDGPEYSGNGSKSIIPKQSQAASLSYVVTRRSGNITLKFELPGGAQKSSVGSLEPTSGIPESYCEFPMKLSTDDIPPEPDTDSEEDDDEGEEEEEAEEEHDHGPLKKILGNLSVPAYLSSKTEVSQSHRGIGRPFSAAPTLPSALKLTPLAKSPFIPQSPQPIQAPSPFMGFGSYARNATTVTPPPPSSTPFDPMKPESNFTFIKPTSITPLAWKPIIPIQKPSTNTTSSTPAPWTTWRPILPLRKPPHSSSVQIPSPLPGLMISPPILEPEVQAYEYVHEPRNDSDLMSSAAPEANDEVEDEAFAFSSDDDQQPNDGDDDLLADMTGENSEPIKEEDEEQMEQTFARMTSGDQPSSIDHQMADFEPSLDYDPLAFPVYIWTGPNPVDEYYANLEMTSSSAPTPPQPDPNVASRANEIEMTSIIETDLNNEGEVHQQAPDSNDEYMSDSSNINIGLVSITETVSNTEELVYSEQPVEPIITESDMSNIRFSNISSRSVVDLDWDIEEPDTSRPNGPIALMGEEAILRYISADLESDVSDQHVTELVFLLEKWSVSESEIVTTTSPPEMGPNTGTNPSPQDPLPPDVSLDLSQLSASNVSLESSQQSNQEAASISEQEQDTNSSQSSLESELIKTLKEQLRKANKRADDAEAKLAKEKKAREDDQKPASRIQLSSALELLDGIRQGFENAIHHTSMEKEFEGDNEARAIDEYIPLSANLIRRLRREVVYLGSVNATLKHSQEEFEQLVKDLLQDAIAKPPAEQSAKKPAEEPAQQPLHLAVKEQSEKKPAKKPVRQALRPAVEQQPAKKLLHNNFMLDILADPWRVDPVPVQSGPVDPPSVDPRIKSRSDQLLGGPCKVNLKTMHRTAKERLESEEAMRLEELKCKSREQRLQEENMELVTSNITSANVPLSNSNNISADFVLPANNNDGSAAPRPPTLRGIAATLAISFLIPMAVRFIL